MKGKDVSMQPPLFRVYLFGPLEVLTHTAAGGWQPLAKKAWGDNKHAQSVLKRLLSAPARRVSRGIVQETLWPSHDETLTDKYFHNAISLLYSIFGKTHASRTGSLYGLAGQ